MRVVPFAVSSTTETSSPPGCVRRSHGASTTHAGIERAVAFEDVALVVGRAARRREADRRCSRSRARSGTAPTATRGRGTCRAGGRPAGEPAARRRRSGIRRHRRRSGARRARQLLEARPAHQRALVLFVEHSLRLGQAARRSPTAGRLRACRSRCRPGTLGSPSGRSPRSAARDGVLVGEPVEAHLPVPERLDQLERQRPRAEDARLAVGAEGVVHLARCRTC